MPSQQTITFLAIEVARMLRQRFEAASAEAGLGITPGEARTLAYVSRFSGMRQAALADLMSVEPMTLVGFLDRLEARGLIQRTVDPSDRRAKLISATPEAAPLIQRIDEIGNRIRKTATASLGRTEVEALRAGLASMRESLTTEAKEPA